jgi:hypothetical protein
LSTKLFVDIISENTLRVQSCCPGVDVGLEDSVVAFSAAWGKFRDD